MSDAKLSGYLKRQIKSGSIHGQLIVLSDSKGRYVKDVQYTLPGFDIRFEGRSGFRLFQGLNWLKANLQSLVTLYSHITLNVWLGTCDLTVKKQNHQLALRFVDDDCCYRFVISQIEKYYQLIASYPTVRLVFLQIPPYSIVRWHECKGLPVTKGTKEDDLILFRRINYINEFIDLVNDRHGVSSVRFRLDLYQEKKRPNHPARKSITYKQTLDGIHPNSLLSQVWLKRIVERAIC